MNALTALSDTHSGGSLEFRTHRKSDKNEPHSSNPPFTDPSFQPPVATTNASIFRNINSGRVRSFVRTTPKKSSHNCCCCRCTQKPIINKKVLMYFLSRRNTIARVLYKISLILLTLSLSARRRPKQNKEQRREKTHFTTSENKKTPTQNIDDKHTNSHIHHHHRLGVVSRTCVRKLSRMAVESHG